MKFKPLRDHILVKRIDQEQKTKGGIIIPDTAQEKPQEAEVVAVGDGKRLDNGTQKALNVKVGEKVLFAKYSGTEIKLNDEEHIILKEDDVLGVVLQ